MGRRRASLNAIMADSARRAEGPVTYVGISNYGRKDARVEIWDDPADGGMLYVTNVNEGATGAFLERKAQLGTVPSLGGTLYGLMYPLHFGHFAGILSKAAWCALGVALCFVILSGFRLWVRRRAEDPQWRAFGRVVQVMGYGLPCPSRAVGPGSSSGSARRRRWDGCSSASRRSGSRRRASG